MSKNNNNSGGWGGGDLPNSPEKAAGMKRNYQSLQSLVGGGRGVLIADAAVYRASSNDNRATVSLHGDLCSKLGFAKGDLVIIGVDPGDLAAFCIRRKTEGDMGGLKLSGYAKSGRLVVAFPVAKFFPKTKDSVVLEILAEEPGFVEFKMPPGMTLK